MPRHPLIVPLHACQMFLWLPPPAWEPLETAICLPANDFSSPLVHWASSGLGHNVFSLFFVNLPPPSPLCFFARKVSSLSFSSDTCLTTPSHASEASDRLFSDIKSVFFRPTFSQSVSFLLFGGSPLLQ